MLLHFHLQDGQAIASKELKRRDCCTDHSSREGVAEELGGEQSCYAAWEAGTVHSWEAQPRWAANDWKGAANDWKGAAMI